MSAVPNQPPRHNRRLRDYQKLATGKVLFEALMASNKASDLTDEALNHALYYASNDVTGAVGSNKIRKAVRAEAKKRGMVGR